MILTRKTLRAKTTAVIVALALVATAAAPVASVQAQSMSTAQIQAQIALLLAQLQALRGQVSTSSCVFTRDLTVGSQGADVTCLQAALAAKGYLAVAPTGHFGGLTQAAVARWQAASGVMATGYFGPLSRARFAALNTGGVMVPSQPNDNNDDDDDDDNLSGGEADLSDFQFTREESSAEEGDEEVEVATAEFDVDGGDVNIERLELMAEALEDGSNMEPWEYFDRVYLMVNGDEVASMDVDTRGDWEESDDDVYALMIEDIDEMVDEGDRAELTIAFDLAGSIDSSDEDQRFRFSIEDEGIRVEDGEGVTHYIGDDSETVTFGFGANNDDDDDDDDDKVSGDLAIRSSGDDPDSRVLVADDNDEEYTVFAFEIENRESAEALITDLSIDVNTGSGDAEDVLRTATLSVGGDEYTGDISGDTIMFEDIDLVIDEDESAEFELMVTLERATSNNTISFSIDSSNIEAEDYDSGDDIDVGGSVSSESHSIGRTGISADGTSTSQSVTSPSDSSASVGTFTIRFEVTALEDDLYIDDSAGSSGTVGAMYSIGGNSYSGSENAVLTSSAEKESGFFVVRDGETETFTLTVALNPNAAGTFFVELESIRFNDEASFTGSTNLEISSDQDLETDPIYIPN